MSAAELRAQVVAVLDDLALIVNQLENIDKGFQNIQGDLLVMGISDSNHSIAGAVGMTEAAQQSLDATINHSFNLRQRLTAYRDVL